MTSVDPIRPLSVKLPLWLHTEAKDGQITEQGLKDVAEDLRVNIRLLQDHIQSRKDLEFVSIKGVSYENGLICLTFDLNDKEHLRRLFKCLGNKDNEFSKWISTYFMMKSLEVIAGLSLCTHISCGICMMKSLYLKCEMEFCIQEEEFGDSHARAKIETETRDKTNEPSLNLGKVNQKIKELEQISKDFTLSKYFPAEPQTDSERQSDEHSYQTTELSFSEKMAVVRKSFLLYFPFKKGWKVKKLQIESDCKCLNADMKMHSKDMYEYSVDVPVNQKGHSYQYVCHLKSDSRMNVKDNLMGTPPVKSIKFYLDENAVQRDSWVENGHNLRDPSKFNEECLRAHLSDILFHCSLKLDIEDGCRQLEHVCYHKLPKQLAIRLLKDFALCLSTDKSRLLFVVAIGNILTNPQCITQSVDKSTAKMIMTDINKFNLRELPQSCETYICTVCLHLCMIIFGPSLSMLEYLNTCYPFYDGACILKNLQSNLREGRGFAPDKESLFLDALAFCRNLCIASEAKSSKNERDALEILLRHLPFEMTLGVLSKLSLEMRNQKDMCNKETALQNLFYSILHVRIEAELKTIKKNRNLRRLSDVWIKIHSLKLEENVQSKIEDNILSILETYPSNGERTCDIVMQLIKQYKFFQAEKDRKNLLCIVMGSQNENVRELFFCLHQCEELALEYKALKKETFQTFCMNYVTRVVSVPLSRNEDFQVLLKRVCSLWDVHFVRQNTELNDIVSFILKRELEKYHPRQLLQQLKTIDEMSDTNEKISNVFIEHIKGILDEKAEKPEDLMKLISDRSGIPLVETRLAARLVCTILDNYGTQETSSDFDNFLRLVSHYPFWIVVFQCSGKFSDIIRLNVNYINASSCITKIASLFSTHEVHYDFVRKLEKNSYDACSAKKLLELKCESSKIRKYWSDALMKFKEVKDNLALTQEVMSTVKKKMRNLPVQFDELLKRIHDNEVKLDTGKITANECNTSTHLWWGIEPLPEICKYLKGVVHSEVFWNVCADKVCEEYLFQSEDEEEDDPLSSLCKLFQEKATFDRKHESSTSSIMCFFEVLQITGSSEYGAKWRDLIGDDKIQLVEVFRMFGSTSNVSQEFDIARTYLHIAIDKEVEECLKNIILSNTLKNTVEAIESAVDVFELDLKEDDLFANSLESFNKLLLGAAEEYTFREVQIALKTVFSLVKNLSDDTVNIIIALGRATTLVSFLKSIVDEDIKNLIDAVEDISEQQVRESTVSAMIEVKQFLHPLLLSKGKLNCSDFLKTLEKQTKSSRTNSSSLPQKVEDCIQNLHNLKSLYNGVANRGEQTKEMIKNIVLKGSFHFQLNRSHTGITFEASYKQNNMKERRKKSTLIDLRSRALLLMNTEKMSSNESRFNRDELSKFVGSIDLCLDIADILYMLYSSGHSHYMTVKEILKPQDLKQKEEELNRTLNLWFKDVTDERDSHFLMNFVQGSQIHILFKYLEQNTGEAYIVQTILNFIHPEMKSIHLKNIYDEEKSLSKSWSNRRMLHCMGFSLHLSFEGLKMFQRTMQCQKIKTLTSIVQPNRLTVAQLEEGSLHTVKTVLALYLNTTQRLPEPNHILFCTSDTSWTELELLIRRCLGANDFYKTKVLFCIANVEMLSNEIQLSLVEKLRQLPKDKKFLLAVICRGSRNHHCIDELSDCVTSVPPATDKTVRDIFKEHCDNVVTVTSSIPGLGKTSYITSDAHKQQKRVVTLHVSGSIRKMSLVKRINDLRVRSFHVLHIDLSNVESPSELDTFLFELVVLRYVSAGNVSANLNAAGVFIEIANTINDTLRNALQTAVLFKRKQLEWNGIEDFIISRELNSPVQVVCHYLKCLGNGSIDGKDVLFDSKSGRPLSSKQCKALLKQYTGEKLDSSFPAIFTFVNVLADQLKKMSLSSFFKVNRLFDMIGNKSPLTVKSKLIEAMIDVSSDFATRSVALCRESQISTIDTEENYKSNLAASAEHRVDSLIRWEDSNHLMFVFHNQNINTISALYRNLSKVPNEVKNLFESQMKKKMEDFSSMDQDKLQTILQKVARINPFPLPKEELLALSRDYALTADNLLKMVLIMLRVKANIPVVIMGETGCGKTSLIQYLATICEVGFDVMNIHAGVKEEEIVQRVSENNANALTQLSSDRWLFLDEINTSDNIGIISDLICHHRCLEKELAPNLIIMGACNPYKLRSSRAISTAGLEGKAQTDELSRLVYRVLPLPEMMVDYVWDFGSLNEKDEEIYIHRMVSSVFPRNYNHHQLFTSLLAVSQSFVRRKEDSTYSVSLRDVHRCKTLATWFLEVLPKKKLPIRSKSYLCDINIKAMILSLAHCYQSRFADKQSRKDYRCKIGDIFRLNGHDFEGEHDVYIQTIIKEEQSDILRRMKLPPGTARNTALQENVFVILVCIFNRIPIFVVGKPGCSKSLAMQLIKSNLRGKDSEDEFFRELPQLYCVSFQGSESSTSDGIIKVFAKAEKYQESNDIEEVLSVVILDEIGLAEVSRFNPLKVLHNLLEPDGASQPKVAVVGISNWALDASKMNRAIHLSRTDMDEDELFDTAISISESFIGYESKQSLFQKSVEESSISLQFIKEELNGMAKAYFQYINELRFKNFHGLRDYYSLIKYVARMFAEKGHACSEEVKAEIISEGIARNFGGLPDEIQTLYDVFQRYLSLVISKDKPLTDMITENIRDPLARHLMLITTGESVLGIIEQQLNDIGCDRKEVIFGSQFEEDLTDDYNYRILSRIILCMEEGVVLILKDLESIYGSLYDMLNQNYTIIGKKKNCRIALGPYSNPICHVADSFRCIVLTDEKKLYLTDPPFLNRFEKQYLRYFDIIMEKQMFIIKKLEDWIEELSDTSEGHIAKEEIFPMYNKDLTTSLVLKTESDCSCHLQDFEDKDYILNECKQRLLWIIKPEIVIRQRLSNSRSIQISCDEMIRQYLHLPVHNGLEYFVLQQAETIPSEELSKGLLNIVFTNSNVHTKIDITSIDLRPQIEKLGAFKSEKQLSSKIQSFWNATDLNILIVQCNAKDDEKHILLTKLVIERYRNDYMANVENEPKHVYFIIHLDRSKAESHSVSQLNFISEWKLVMMDSLDRPVISIPDLYRMTLQEAIMTKKPLTMFIKEEMFWAFSRIRYESFGRDVTSISDVLVKIEDSPEMMEIFETKILSSIRKTFSAEQDKFWLLHVACDITALTSSASFVDALDHFIMNKIKTPLAKLVFRIEKTGILESFFQKMEEPTESPAHKTKRMAWLSGIHDTRLFSIEDIPDETGPECYTCETADFCLKMPFSKHVYESIEATKDDFMEMIRTYRVQCLLNDDEELPAEVYDEVLLQQEHFLLRNIPDLTDFTYEDWEFDYFEDFCTLAAHIIFTGAINIGRTEFLKLILKRLGIKCHDDPFVFIIRLHSTFWVNFPFISSEMILIDRCICVIPESRSKLLVVFNQLNEIINAKKMQEKDTFYSNSSTLKIADSKQREETYKTTSASVKPLQNDLLKDDFNYKDISDSGENSAEGEDKETDSNAQLNDFRLQNPDEANAMNLQTTESENSYELLNESGNLFLLKSDKEHLFAASAENEGLGAHQSLPFPQFEEEKNSCETMDLHRDAEDNQKNNADNKSFDWTGHDKTETLVEVEKDISTIQTDESLQMTPLSHPYMLSQANEISSTVTFDKTVNRIINEKEILNSNEYLPYISDNLTDVTGSSQIDTEIVNDINDACRETLVDTVCKAFLPTKTCLQYHGGLKHWLEEVTSTVSFAAKVSMSPDVLYSLRVCIELAAELIIPLELDCDLLEQIGTTLHQSNLDAESVFCSIVTLVEKAMPVSNNMIGDVRNICHRLLASYFFRCFSANPFTDAYQFLFRLVLQNFIPGQYVTLFKVPVNSFLQTINRDICHAFLSTNGFTFNNPDMVNSYNDCELKFLESLDGCVRILLTDERFEDPFLVLVTDLLQDIYQEEILTLNKAEEESNFNCRNGKTDICLKEDAIELFYICHKAMKEHDMTLKYIGSIAYCKSFVRLVAMHLQYANSEDYTRILGILDVALSDLPGEETHFLVIFFMKEMLTSLTLSQLIKFCHANEDKYNFLRGLEWTKKVSIMSFENSQLCLHVKEPIHKEYCFNCESFQGGEFKSKIDCFFTAAKGSLCLQLQFLSFGLREFYLQLIESDIDDTRRTLASVIMNKIMDVGMSKDLRVFIACILGEQNFDTKDFVVTVASSEFQICKSSFLTTLYSLVLAHNEFRSNSDISDNHMSIVARCLILPDNIKSYYIPGFRNLLTTDVTETVSTKSRTSSCMGMCQCGVRVSTDGTCGNQISCVVCGQNITLSETYAISNCPLLPSKGKEFDVNNRHSSEEMNPITSHLLQMLVKGCLLGSLALGNSSEQILESILSIPENDVASCLSSGIDSHWNIMKEILHISYSTLAAILHAVLLKASSHLFGLECCFESIEETVKWERMFDKIVCSVLESRCTNIRTLYQQHNRIHHGDKRSLTMCLLESDDLDKMTSEDKRVCMPTLYRIRASTRKSNFQFELTGLQDKYPFITEVLDQEKKLQLPKHILNLIQWHAATVANASYMLKHHDCSMMTVQDFIYFKQDTMKKNVIKTRFESFRKSWDKLRLCLPKDDISNKMKRIHSESKVNDCLILNEDSLPYKVLGKLVSLQNSFLDKVLLIARKCDALKMLKRDGLYVLPCVHIMELKKHQLIHCKVDWECLLQQESHCNLSYGCGTQIHYDFHSIEESLARDLIFGKSYIVAENSIPEIVFIDELHRNYASLIRELRKNVPQQPLPAEVRNGIRSRKDEDPRMSTELLKHLGIVMTLLKKTSGDSDQSVVDFVDKWKSTLCRSFPKKLLPSPESSVKLCHIVALSELLEEFCADSVKEGLGDEYREKLDDPLHDHIMLQLENEKLTTVLFQAIKRFTYRCLASKIADPKQSLRMYLCDESFWPMDTFHHNTLMIGGNEVSISDVLPDGLMVRHIFESYDLIEAEIEKRRQRNIKMSGFATSFQTTKPKAATTSKLAQKKSKLRNMRKF